MGTRGQWSIDMLKSLGNNNPNEKTQNLVSSWTLAEGTKAKYNPLATTLDYGTNTKFNNCCGGNGVKNYLTRAQGIEATVLTLKGNHSGYSTIVKGLIGNDPELALRGMHLSPWGTNFIHVETVWRMRDVRSEALDSETATPVSIAPNTPVHTPLPIRPGDLYEGGSGINPLGPDGSTTAPGGYNGIIEETPNLNADNVRKYIMLSFGIALAGISALLFVMVVSRSDTVESAVSIAKVIA